jgi:hypothetical protein
LPDIDEIRITQLRAPTSLIHVDLCEYDQSVRIFEGKRAEHHGLDGTENGGVGPDTQGQGQHGQNRERWIAPELSHRESDVLSHLIHLVRPAHFPGPLFVEFEAFGSDVFDIAEHPSRFPVCRSWIPSLFDQFLRALVEMKSQFVFEIGVRVSSPENPIASPYWCVLHSS